MTTFKDWIIDDGKLYHDCKEFQGRNPALYALGLWHCIYCPCQAPKELNDVCALAEVSTLYSVRDAFDSEKNKKSSYLLSDWLHSLDLRSETAMEGIEAIAKRLEDTIVILTTTVEAVSELTKKTEGTGPSLCEGCNDSTGGEEYSVLLGDGSSCGCDQIGSREEDETIG